MLNTFKITFCTIVVALFMSCGGEESVSETKDVSDIQTMNFNSSTGLFDVFCKDGSKESVSSQQILANQVCRSGGSGGGLQAVYRACDSIFSSAYETRCAGIAKRYRMNAQQIQQCGSAFDGDASEFACVEAAGKAFVSAESIKACATLADGDANELACVKVAGRPLTAKEVNMCASGFDGDSNEIACVRISCENRLTASDIKYCVDRANGDAAELQCLKNF